MTDLRRMDILLATYNAHPYLNVQLDSLLAQEYQNFRILIRDGGSADDTVDVILEYQRRYPEKIRFLGSQKASAPENFSELLKASSEELVMFCDQDDYWIPQKISHTLRKYTEAEKIYGAHTPILVFTDSGIADQKLRILNPSMLNYQYLDVEHLTLNRLIPQNVPSGNTMLLNRALIDLMLPIPPDAVMHDHWASLVASVFGKIVFLNESTLYYRQHAHNIYGAFCYSAIGMLKKIQYGRKKIKERFEQNIRQAAAFGKRYESSLSSRDREMLRALENWNDYGFLRRRKILLKYHILKSGFLRNLGMFFLI